MYELIAYYMKFSWHVLFAILQKFYNLESLEIRVFEYNNSHFIGNVIKHVFELNITTLLKEQERQN